MNSDKIRTLENNFKLKKKVFGKDVWKNYAFIPPSLIIFTGITGILYLLNNDRLISLYSIPFIILFFIGTIWLKSTKKYLIDEKIKASKYFLICLPTLLTKEEGQSIILFNIGKNRNNKYFLESEKKSIMNKDLRRITSEANRDATRLDDSDFFITKQPASKKISDNERTQHWILFYEEKKVIYITDSELNKYL